LCPLLLVGRVNHRVVTKGERMGESWQAQFLEIGRKATRVRRIQQNKGQKILASARAAYFSDTGGVVMRHTVTATDKKQFIRWFLDHYELKNPEAEWLMQYLAQNEPLLSRVHFTDHFRNLPKAMLLSTTCVQMTAFKYYKNKRVTSDVEKAFLDVHNHPEEDLYITLYFSDRNACREYNAVLEGGSQVEPPSITKADMMISLQAEMWLDELERGLCERELREQIDRALDTRDRVRFGELSLRLSQLSGH